jgi:tetratricopeptide (TPR) repeat protein
MKGDRTIMPALTLALICSMFSNVVCAQSNVQQRDTQGPGPNELRIAGMSVYDRGYFLQAERLLERAIALAADRRDTYILALLHDDLGCIYHDEFEFIKAEREFRQAIDILRRQPEHSHALATSLANLGTALSGERRYQEASTSLSEASKLIKDNAVDDPALRLHILDVSGALYLKQGQVKKAEALFLRALNLDSEPDKAINLQAVDVLNNLGTLYARNGNYQRAVASYTHALRLSQERFGPSHPNLTILLGNLGFAYIRMGHPDEAEPQFLRILAILEDKGLNVSNMSLYALYGLAQTYLERNQLERAEPLLAQAVNTGHMVRAKTPEMAETLELYSSVLRSLSKYSEAENLHTEAARIRAELVLTMRVFP